MKNILIKIDDSMMLITSNENEDDEKLPTSQTPWLHEHIN
jgi:hypothetical protein